MANVAWPATSRMHAVGRHAPTDDASLIPSAVIENKTIGPGAKLVYSKLLDYAWANETATNNRLATDLAVSPRSARNYLAELKAAGLVQVRLHPGKPSSYTLTASI